MTVLLGLQFRPQFPLRPMFYAPHLVPQGVPPPHVRQILIGPPMVQIPPIVPQTQPSKESPNKNKKNVNPNLKSNEMPKESHKSKDSVKENLKLEQKLINKRDLYLAVMFWT